LKISFKLYGVFRSAAGSGNIQLELLDSASTVRTAIMQLVSYPVYRGVRQLLLDQDTTDPRPNALIMVSGREIGTLEGLDTKLGDSDEVSLLPIAHGG
jgi:molybdopterin converting factor small subunit